MVLFVIAPDCDAWRRRRRRRCTPRSCEVSYWSSWGTCSSDQCGQQGSQRRSRSVESSPNCGGKQCPDLFETRLCYGSKPVNCHLSYWSEWSACTTVCGVSGKQTIYRHRIRTEQCGGVCTSTFYETRACPLTSCLNGGRNKILPSSQKWPLRDLFFFFLVIVQKTEVKDSASDVNVTHISYCGLA